MRSVTIAVLLATATLAASLHPLDIAQDLIAMPSSNFETRAPLPPPPVKLDKTLRRALLKALVDLEAESAEQAERHKKQEEGVGNAGANNQEQQTLSEEEEEAKYDFLEISKQKSASFTFDGFPNEEDIPSEDKLQNSSFVETDKYASGQDAIASGDDKHQEASGSSSQQPPTDYTKGVQVHHVVPSEKNSAIYETKPAEQLESVESRNVASSSSSSAAPVDPSQIQKSVTFAPIIETLSVSASGNVASAAANSLSAPRPTVSTLALKAGSNSTSKGQANAGSKSSPTKGKLSQEGAEEVKIFQAPLVAAFTVQQDERGVPKSVVPLYRTIGSANGTALPQVQPLSLQEQLEFKQRLLEKQLAQLQAQQAQQQAVLQRQRQAYEEQLRFKQQQEFYQQEQRRLKILQEQELQQQRLIQQQRLQQQFPPVPRPAQQFQQNQIPFQPPPPPPPPQQQHQLFSHQLQLPQQQQLPQIQQQQSFKPHQQQQQQQQPPQQQQLPHLQQQQNFKTTSVQLQPSLTLEVPSVAPAPIFHNTLRQLQPPRAQNNVLFPGPVEFQQPPAVAPLSRFNRQEAFGNVGNFGFNNFQNPEKQQVSFRNNNQFAQPQRIPQNNNFGFNQFRPQQQQRPFVPAVTPARQIQELLYQSGIAGDLQGAGTRNQEDINIVSKVLALNVGALPGNGQIKGFQQSQQRFPPGVLKK